MLLAVALLSVAQAKPLPEDHPDHAYHYESQPLKAGDITATAPVAWARQGELKVKVALDNDTDHYVVMRKDGIAVTTGGQAFQPERKPDRYEVVGPLDEGAHQFVILDESNGLHHDAMEVALTAVYTADPGVDALSTADTHIPARNNNFDVGDFACSVKGSIKRKTDVMVAKYTCTFQGEPGTVGFVTGSEAQVGIADGTTFANADRDDLRLLMPGDSVTITVENTTIQPRTHGVDMQFDELTVKWDGVFRQATLVPLSFAPWTFSLDASLTAAKND